MYTVSLYLADGDKYVQRAADGTLRASRSALCQGSGASDDVANIEGSKSEKKKRDDSYWRITLSSPEELNDYDWLSLPRIVPVKIAIALEREILKIFERRKNYLSFVEDTSQQNGPKLQCCGPKIQNESSRPPMQRIATLKSEISEECEHSEAYMKMLPDMPSLIRLQALLCGLEARLELEQAQVHSIVHVSHFFCVCNDMAWPVSSLC